jgi:hypothetical protein
VLPRVFLVKNLQFTYPDFLLTGKLCRRRLLVVGPISN